jgi:ribosomal protein S18 acetylase RimI-like enzyme
VHAIRAATAADYPAFAALSAEPNRDDIPSRERWLDDYTLVDDAGGVLGGYVSFYRLHTAGFVRSLVVSPLARGGIGEQLMRAAASSLRAAGVAEWRLNVKPENTPAIALYEKLGMIVEHRSTVLSIAWADTDRLVAEAATALPIDPAEDEDVERGLGLLPGRLAMARTRPDRVLVQLRDAACAPVGVAGFDPPRAIAFPFRVAGLGLTAPLLAALRPHARHARFQLVIEDDDALAAMLEVAGAAVARRLLHYRGAL